MLRSMLLASVIALGATGAAMAQGGPVLVGGGADGGPRVVYDSVPANNILGGAQVAMSGGAQERTYSYGAVSSFPARAGTLIGGGDEAQVIYGPAQQAGDLASLGAGAPRS